jgi:hypothetical protein
MESLYFGCRRAARFGINCVRLALHGSWYVNFMPQPTQAILADDMA